VVNMASRMQIARFNDIIKDTITLLRAEYPGVKEIGDLERKANLALAANPRVLYEAFRTHIKNVFGEKILASDESFIDDAKREHSDHSLLPCIVQCWERPGAKTTNVLDLQIKLLTRLQQLCDNC